MACPYLRAASVALPRLAGNLSGRLAVVRLTRRDKPEDRYAIPGIQITALMKYDLPQFAIIDWRRSQSVYITVNRDSRLRITPEGVHPAFAAQAWHFGKSIRVDVQHTIDMKTVDADGARRFLSHFEITGRTSTQETKITRRCPLDAFEPTSIASPTGTEQHQ